MSATNPSSGETPRLNLPPPVGEQPVDARPRSGGAQPEAAAQVVPAAPERAPSAAAAGAAAAQPVIPLPATDDNANPLAQTQQNDVNTTTGSAKTRLIQDEDLIEKEWVDRAKRIVDQTRNDPHQQSEQLTMVKADYMKKRYDKTIKVSK